MILKEIINDVASRLSLSDNDYSDDCLDAIAPRDLKMILNGLRRLFDRFSIDERRLPSICEMSHTIKSCDTRLTVGKDCEFDLWDHPNKIHYAAWTNSKNKNEIRSCDRFYYGLCDYPINVREDDGNFHHQNYDKEYSFGYNRPTELYYQRNGEIVFNQRPQIGDVLTIRATMPFKLDINACKTTTLDKPMVEFDICPRHELTNEAIKEIEEQALCDYDGCEDWHTTYCINPCPDNECNDNIEVTVTAREVKDFCPEVVSFNTVELPNGYYSAIVDMLVYDLAGWARITPDVQMTANNVQAKILLARRNSKVRPEHRDFTTPWSKRKHHDDDYSIFTGNVVRGKCG